MGKQVLRLVIGVPVGSQTGNYVTGAVDYPREPNF
jgi:hypothetical protein